MQSNSASRAVREPIRQDYDERVDVLTLHFMEDMGQLVSDDTPSGLIVYYLMPSHEPAAVEVLRYCLRFGSEAKTLHVDAEDTPFDAWVGPVECGDDATENMAAFNNALRTILAR
jgi:hypothetical protein